MAVVEKAKINMRRLMTKRAFLLLNYYRGIIYF